MALDFKIKRALRGLDYDPRLWLPIWMAPIDIPSLEELFSETVDIEDLYSEAIEQWKTCPQTDLVDKTLQFYTKLYLQDDILTKVDRASMMHSLEVRAPFLDIEVVDLVRRIPANYKLRNGTTKYILKKAVERAQAEGKKFALTEKGVYTEEARELCRVLVQAGCSQALVGDVVEEVLAAAR